MLVNPTKESEANRIGIVYVVKRMNWYWNLSDLLLEDSFNGESYKGLRSELKAQIVDLYKALLLYQMKSVMSYYHNRGLVILRDIIKLDDWDGNLKSIQGVETTFYQDCKLYNSQQISYHHEQDTELLQNIHQSLQDQASLQREIQEEEDNKKCLKDLHLTNPGDDMKRIEQTKGGLFDDSYQWILKRPEFLQWRDNKHHRLLWIKGDPGKGKTMLLMGIVKELSRQPQAQTPDAGFLSFFFCQGTDVRLNNATGVLRGLIYLLLLQQKALISHLRRKYDHAGQRLFEDTNAFYALSEILRDMLHDPKLREAYIIIDALDECETGLPELLNFIVQNASTSHQTKWIVSSRNEHRIQKQLELNDTRIRLNLELNATYVSYAVEIYIKYKLSQLTSLKSDQTLQRKVQDQVCRKANGTFLWVALVLKELQDVESWDMLQVIEEMPTDLIPFYDRMIKQIRILKHKYPEFCLLVLSTMTFSYRPLHLLELAVLSGLPDQISGNIESVKLIVEMCGSFLTIREDYVYLIHQSAKDYLSKSATIKVFPSSGRAEIHHVIFSRSMEIMVKTLRKDLYNLRYPGLSIDQVKKPDPDPLATVRYSCIYWVDHLLEGNDCSKNENDLRNSEMVYRFIQKHFLVWLEALSLTGNISTGVLAIIKLESIIKVDTFLIISSRC